MSPRRRQYVDENAVPTLREPQFSQSVERGMAVLACFTPKRPDLGIAEIADTLGMSRSTTHRYASTLVALGYMEQTPSRRYRLSLRVTNLGISTLNSTGLREHTHLYLESLCQQCSYTVNIAVLDGPEILYIDRVRSLRREQVKFDLNLTLGSRLPAYCTAMGKLLLAYLPASEQRRALSEITLVRHTPNTIIGKRRLRDALEEIHIAGLAINDQELSSGLRSIAAPICDESQEVVAAVNIAALSSMISVKELVDNLAPHLISTADRISARLGYRREDQRWGEA